MPAYAYTRCSHRDSEESGAGLAAQDSTVQRMFDEVLEHTPSLTWAEARAEHERPGHFCDKTVSAYRVPFTRRPAGSLLWPLLKKGDFLFVSAVDRMFRSLPDMAKTFTELEKRGVHVRFGNIPQDTSTPMGRLILHQLVVFAQWESDLKSMRQKEAHAIRVAFAAAGKPIPEELKTPGDKEKPSATRKRDRTPIPEFDPAILRTVPRLAMAQPINPTDPGVIYAYIRCSHMDSVDSGLGLEWQRRTCMRQVERMLKENPNLRFGGLFCDEAVSAWKHRFEKRPEASRLAGMLQRGDHVVFARHDRAFRSVRDMSSTLPRWQDQGVTIHFVADNLDCRTPIGKAIISMLAVFAELEPAMTSTRTREALHELHQQGRGLKLIRGFKFVETPLGTTLVPDREEIALIRLAYTLTTIGKLSSDKAAARIEQIIAKRENRRPIPEAGIDLCFAERWFGKDFRQYGNVTGRRSVRTGKKYPQLFYPRIDPRCVRHHAARWPILAEYLDAKRSESRLRRDSFTASVDSEESGVTSRPSSNSCQPVC